MQPVSPFTRHIRHAGRRLLALALLLSLWLTLYGRTPTAEATATWLWHGGNIVAGGVATDNVLPGQAATIWLKVGYQNGINQARIYYTTNGSVPDGSYDTVTNGTLVVMTFDHTEPDNGNIVDWWKGVIPAQAQGVQVRYKISTWHSGGGSQVYAESPVGKTLTSSAEATTFGYHVSAYSTPTWVKDAVIYQVFIDRFFDGNTVNNIDCATGGGGYCVNDIFKWNGGDLAGAQARLDYLQSLGINTLWVTPVYENPVTQIGSLYDQTPGEIYNYHGYEAQDFLDVEDNFGTNADFQALVNAAHAAGMKVILDFVPNHSSNQHPYFKDASDNCVSSPYFRWYKFGTVDAEGKLLSYDNSKCVAGHSVWWGDNDTYANFFAVKEMPQLDNDFGPARQATISQALTWVNTYGVDGLRLDYAPGPSHSFWLAFRAAVKAANPNVFLVGEVWTGGGSAERKSYEGELDGVLAFDHLYTFENFFATRTTTVDQFDSDLAYYEGYYNPDFVLPSFLDNHDTDRFLFRAGGNIGRLKMAYLAQITLPDPPVIYYGTEVGLSQSQANAGHPEYSRGRMPWSGYLGNPPSGWNASQNTGLRDFVDTLIGLRNSQSALRNGDRVALYRHNLDSTYAYRRTDANGSILVALNNSDATRALSVPNLPGASLLWPDGTLVQDALTGANYTVTGGKINLSLAALTGAVLVPQTFPATVTVNFTVNNYVTQYGENIYVVGSVPELGSWSPTSAVKLNWVDSDTWSGPVVFSTSKGTTVEYKYIVRNGSGTTTWESGSNRTCAVPASGSATANDFWSQTPGNGCTPSGGAPLPLGATIVTGGVQFALYSANATRVELSIFSTATAGTPSSTVALSKDPATNIWSTTVNGLGAGAYYGYRVWGPNWQYMQGWTPGTPKANDTGFIAHVDVYGNRFNPNKLLTDPYAKAVTGEFARVWDALDNSYHYHPSLWGGTDTNAFTDSAAYAPKSVVIDDSAFNWTGNVKPNTALDNSVIYEVHVRGFSKADPGLAVSLQGTYDGMAAKASYLQSLGVTAVELLPIHEYPQYDDPIRSQGATQDRVNYWGYMTTNFFAPNREYACTDMTACSYVSGEQVNKFKALVKSLHAAGIEVWLDVVFNHTAEGGVGADDQVKYYNLRGIDNRTYYTLQNDKSLYYDTTGTGNNLNASRPATRQLILDSLTYWADVMQVDGFRFDLAYTLGRESNDGRDFNANAQTLTAIASLAQSKGVKIVAEPWDAGGYGVGQFPAGWSEWNGVTRDSHRRFTRGDDGQVSGFATAIVADTPGFGAPPESINFTTAHDGFTMNDLTSYVTKQNGVGPCNPSGADPDSGSNDNYSADYGGDDAVRERQIRNFAVELLTHQGVPMLLAGDEFRDTQSGNNNGYMADNTCGWLDWSLSTSQADVRNFFSKLIAFRKAHPALTRTVKFDYTDGDSDGVKDHTWHGVQPGAPDWGTTSHTLAFLLDGSAAETGGAADAPDIYVAYNAWTSDLSFTLPAAPNGKQWYVLADTSSNAISWGNIYFNSAITDWNLQVLPRVTTASYSVQARSTIILLARPLGSAEPVLSTGFLNPAANIAATGGDGNGFETSPTNVYTDNATFATDLNSGTGTSTSCTNTGKDRHRFYNYNINLPAQAVVKGLEVRLDARADSTASTPKLCVQLSWDGGTTWTAMKSTANLTASEQTYILGGAADTWGRTWTSTQLNNTNFRVQVVMVSSSVARDFYLDWLAVQAYYQ